MLRLKVPWPKSKSTGSSERTAKGVTKFGLLSYREANLGDDIQAFAALQLMPRIDYFVHRDSIGDFAPYTAWENVKIILNGWFINSTSWPPPPVIEPLFVSFHVAQRHYSQKRMGGGKAVVLGKKSVSYLKEHGPVGCRDLSTLRLLEAAGIQAYFSGCLTLTLGSILEKEVDARAREEILLVEPNLNLRALFKSIPGHLKQRTAFVSHSTELTDPPELRLATVSAMLRRYAAAKLVITSRLHCALPCLAFGTPTLFVPPNCELERLSGVSELFNMPRVNDGEINETIPWDDPIPNPEKHHLLTKQLLEKCRSFLRDAEVE